MNKREAIEELEKRKAFLMAQCDGCWDPAIEMALQALKATLWRTGYPDQDGVYIAMVKGSTKPTALKFRTRWDGEDNVWNDDWHRYEVIHWMPMPDAPEVEK